MVTKVSNSTAVLALLVVAVVLLGGARLSEAVTCNLGELTVCQPAISSGQMPSAECCNKLKEQKPCLCGYLKNPKLRPYITSPGAQKVAKSCGVPIPKC